MFRLIRLFSPKWTAILVLCCLFLAHGIAQQTSIDLEILERVRQGYHAFQEGRLEEALDLYLKCLESAEEQQDHLTGAWLQGLIGEIYEIEGRYQTALIHYERGLQILGERRLAREVEKIRRASEGILPEKAFSASRGQPVSVDLYRGELAQDGMLVEKWTPVELERVLLTNAANMYLQQNQFSQADQLYQQALERMMASSPERVEVVANLAWSSIKRKDLSQARAYLAKALEDLPHSKDRLKMRRAFLALGVLLREEGVADRSQKWLEEALTLYRLASDQEGLARATAHRATAFLLNNELALAIDEYGKALEINETVQDPETGWHATGGLARSYHLMGKSAQAVEQYEVYLSLVDRIGEDFTTDQGKVSFLENHEQIFRDYVDLALELATTSGNYHPARKAVARVRARALESLQAAQVNQSGPSGVLEADYVFSVENQLASADSGHRPFGVPDMAAQMALGVPSGRSRPGNDQSAEEDLALSPRGSHSHPAFLEYYVLSDRSVIFLSRAGKVYGSIENWGEAELDQKISAYRESLGTSSRLRGVTLADQETTALQQDDQRAATLGRELYDMLIAPVETVLPSQSLLVIVPHRSLWMLPFAALQDARGNYLGDKCLLAYSPSETIWHQLDRRQRRDWEEGAAFLAGNPEITSDQQACGQNLVFDPLPGAEEEVVSISQLFNHDRVDLFLGEEADRLRLEAWHPDYSVLHFATHGVACPEDPLSSFIILSEVSPGGLRLDLAGMRLYMKGDPRRPVNLVNDDLLDVDMLADFVRSASFKGVLDARTIAHRFRLNADLVTLSACQTAVGKVLGQGNIGLVRALLGSGARSVLASLWRVDDEATRQLMVAFYEIYLSRGDKALSLQSAMKRVRLRFPEPRFWAAFTLVGLSR